MNFDTWAGDYTATLDRLLGGAGATDRLARRKADALLELAALHLGPPDGLALLDLGCGVGLTDRHLVGAVRELWGVDPAPETLAAARTANPAARYAASLSDVPQRHFDLAFTFNVLHHVAPEERDALCVRLAETVRPGGLVVVLEHNPLNPLTQWIVARCEFDVGVTLLSRREVVGRLTRAGLELVSSSYVFVTPRTDAPLLALERRARRWPLGAQHLTAARSPR